jgi:hypothetical protein
MLKPGIVFIGAPTMALHQLLCLALYLEAPLALSDETSYHIAKKFSPIIPIYLLSQEFNFTCFVSGFKQLFTNLTPQELERFFLTRPDLKKIEILHLLEETQTNLKGSKEHLFCSSFLHHKALVPLNSQWINLGPLGALSYQKHKKALQTILTSFMPKQDKALDVITQIIHNAQGPALSKEDTLDQMECLTLSFEGFDNKTTPYKVLPAHGLVDAACSITKGCLFEQEALALLALHHKKPLLISRPLQGVYEPLNPLISLIPKHPHNLFYLIQNYFEFNTLNREDLITKANLTFFHNTLF